MERVLCVSPNDLAFGHNLSLAEKTIQRIEKEGTPTDLVGVLELWHIRKILGYGCKKVSWSDDYYQSLKSKVEHYNSIIAIYFDRLNPTDIVSLYLSLDYSYRKSFWTIIDEFKKYSLIDSTILKKIIASNINDFFEILRVKNIVEKHKSTIKDVLLSSNFGAIVLIRKYINTYITNDGKDLFLPSNLSLSDKELIVNNYLDSPSANINHVRLLSQAKESAQFKLSPKTKKKIQQVEKKLTELLFNNNKTNRIHSSETIEFVNDESAEPCSIRIQNKFNYTISYSVPFIKKCSSIDRIINFISLFGWINMKSMIELINKRDEYDGIEAFICDKSEYSYPNYSSFERKNRRAIYLLLAYSSVLKSIDSSIEKDLKYYYEVRFKEIYGFIGLDLRFPNETYSWLDRCSIQFTQLESITRQYNVFVKEGSVDKDLLPFYSSASYDECPSKLRKRYLELDKDNEDINRILNSLFNVNIGLGFTEQYKDKVYDNLYALITNESVNYEYCEYFQKDIVDLLIHNKILGVDEKNIIFIVNKSYLEVLYDLWCYEAVSYWSYKEEVRCFLDSMIDKQWLKIDSHLLSKPERDYFSYYLDNKHFTNGLELRNKFAHGNEHSDNEEEYKKAYYSFLMLQILLILKIEYDLYLDSKVKKLSSN